MAPLRPLRIGIRLSTIEYTIFGGPPSGGTPSGEPPFGDPPSPSGFLSAINTYLWTVFFKIDGDKTSVDGNLHLKGTATVIGTPGNHGDLGNTGSDGIYPIPSQLGEYRTVLQPIPVPSIPGMSVGGAIGCIPILLSQNGTPDEAIAHGHDALNSALQSALDNLIPTLGIKKEQPTASDIGAIQQSVTNAVTSAVKDNVSLWQFLGSGGNEDFIVGIYTGFRFSHNDLVNTVATGIPLQAQFSIGPVPPVDSRNAPRTDIWTLSGTIFADPWDYVSLSRFMLEVGLKPTGGIRVRMAPLTSVRKWVAMASPTD